MVLLFSVSHLRMYAVHVLMYVICMYYICMYVNMVGLCVYGYSLGIIVLVVMGTRVNVFWSPTLSSVNAI